mmetsp:Transcript_29811/g.95037  ORF Transcript_29811/g.95037 Transcript_29811/m.95037 type:complete len:272 (+) Transcript_29811:428-1243(+)
MDVATGSGGVSEVVASAAAAGSLQAAARLGCLGSQLGGMPVAVSAPGAKHSAAPVAAFAARRSAPPIWNCHQSSSSSSCGWPAAVAQAAEPAPAAAPWAGPTSPLPVRPAPRNSSKASSSAEAPHGPGMPGAPCMAVGPGSRPVPVAVAEPMARPAPLPPPSPVRWTLRQKPNPSSAAAELPHRSALKAPQMATGLLEVTAAARTPPPPRSNARSSPSSPPKRCRASAPLQPPAGPEVPGAGSLSSKSAARRGMLSGQTLDVGTKRRGGGR